MTAELTALALCALLQVAQLLIYSLTAIRQVGTAHAAGPRDTPHALTDIAGRAQRALNNHFEGLILFSIAVMVVTLSDQSGRLSAACAWAFLGARVLYVPAYLLGWTPGRSIIWAVGFLATVTMLLAALL